MELINEKIVVIDYYKSSNMPIHSFYQHDNNQLKFVIEENGEAADLSNVSRVLVNIKRPDGRVISRELERQENVILYTIQHEEMMVSGHAMLTLQFYDEFGDRLSTAKIEVYFASTVEANVGFKDKEGTLYQQIIMEIDGLKDQLFTLNRLTKDQADHAKEQGNAAKTAAEIAIEETGNLSEMKAATVEATGAANTAAEAAKTAAGTAEKNAGHAKAQGDYAKEQADIVVQRTEELNEVDAVQFHDRLQDVGIPIEQFGAIGGDVDDTEAFIDAINSVPDGSKIILKDTYTVSSVSQSSGDTIAKKNIVFSGLGKFPTIKIKPEILSVEENGTLTGITYSVKDYFEVFETVALGWKVERIQLHTGKIFEYIQVPDKTTIPQSLQTGITLRGEISRVEFEVSGIDTEDPDGEGTARIYFIESQNLERLHNRLESAEGILSENLQVKPEVGSTSWMMDFGTAAVPEIISPNRKLIQSSGKTARIHDLKTYIDQQGVTKNFVVIDSFPPGQISAFYDRKISPINDNENLSIETYTIDKSSFGAFNKMENVTFENIIFDGCNYEVGLKLLDGNAFNIIYTHAAKNFNVQNCIFKNAIAGAIHIGGAGNTFSEYSDFPNTVTIDNCIFENNGRNDIEIIYGRNIFISNCIGDSNLDIEANDDEILENIAINNCSFRMYTPYSPSQVTATSKISLSNCFFHHVVSQLGVNSKISNSHIHKLSPYNGNSLELHGCTVNRWDHTLGECVVSLNNCEIYDLPRTNSGSENMGEISAIRIHGCIVDLSLVDNLAMNRFAYEFEGSTLISVTRKVEISRSYVTDDTLYSNTTIQNVMIEEANEIGHCKYYNCKFLLKDKDVMETLISGVGKHLFVNCFLEGNVMPQWGQMEMMDCILDGTSKPMVAAYEGANIQNVKSNIPQGIDWHWVLACIAPAQLKFNNITVSKNIPELLGVISWQEPVSPANIAAGSTVLYADDIGKHASVLYDNNGVLGLKHVLYS